MAILVGIWAFILLKILDAFGVKEYRKHSAKSATTNKQDASW